MTGSSCPHPAGIAALKKEGKLGSDTQHRQVQYLNNIVEADHDKLKRLIKPTLSFQSLRTVFAALKSFDVMRALKEGQGSLFRYLPGVAGEVCLVPRPSALSERSRASGSAGLAPGRRLQQSPSERPVIINTDKAPTYGVALAVLKREGKLSPDTEHRQFQHLNNRLESDHGKLKRLIKTTLGFQSLKTAFATIKGLEVMRALKKGQGSLFR